MVLILLVMLAYGYPYFNKVLLECVGRVRCTPRAACPGARMYGHHPEPKA